MALELLGTSGCHLCEDAEALVNEVLDGVLRVFDLTPVEIADDPDLMEAYGLQIPVLRYKEMCLYWPFTADDVAQFLSALDADPHH
ncbi:MAG: hypothetical protein RLZ25_2349 [Pseudomonadota bacterium]